MDLDELLSFTVASLSIGFVFASNQLYRLNVTPFLIMFSIAVASVISHEVAHRQVARALNSYSRFVLHPVGLLITLASALPFVPVKFIMPGVTVVMPRAYDHFELRRIEGVTSVAGPVVNIILATLGFLLINLYSTVLGSHLSYAYYLVYVNAWIALFNLLPIPPLDGSKVLRWNPVVYLLSLGVSIWLFLMMAVH
ncbi:MAG: site-2 protease family protein [Thermosphaera aggregans]|uniref:site-2 protease family protein n=1 Tax=Thermosphaera aggregans TaxID=54254 RepID=UPI003BFA8BC4